MKIDFVSMPETRGKTPQQALDALYDHCQQTAVLVMRLNNTVEDLQRKLDELDQRCRRHSIY